jgi:glycosyltransferase involved in cell wall biosynthesis
MNSVRSPGAGVAEGDAGSLSLIRNSEFGGWRSARPVRAAHQSDVCPAWAIQLKGVNADPVASFRPLAASDKPTGLVIETSSPLARLRITQALQFPAGLQHGRFRLSIAGIHTIQPGLNLNWVALLVENAQKKWVFEDMLLQSPRVGPEPAALTVEYLRSVSSSSPRMLALEFSGEAGTVALSSVEFGTMSQPAADASRAREFSGGLFSVSGRRVLGWVADRPSSATLGLYGNGAELVRVTVGGLSSMDANGDPRLRRFGFAAELPAAVAAARPARISLCERASQLEVASIELPVPAEVAIAGAPMPSPPREAPAPAEPPAARAVSPAERLLEAKARASAAARSSSAPAAEARASAPAPSPPRPEAKPDRALTVEAGVDRVEGESLVCWGIVSDAARAVLVTIDGQPVREIEAKGLREPLAGGNRALAEHGFLVPLPAHVLDAELHSVAFYCGATGRRLRAENLRIRFPKREVARAPAPQAPKPSPAPKAPPAEARPKEGASVRTTGRPATAEGAANPLKVAVVAWDMAHNPVGRAFLLADMAAKRHDAELVGPTFAFYGGRIWPPIADGKLPMRSFPATDLKSFLTGAIELARNTRCDVVHVGKPRLPSLVLGALIRHFNDCPMVVDIDDHELAFTKSNAPASIEEIRSAVRDNPQELASPYSELWTRFGETLVTEGELVTVSNVALRRRFGGITVRHGRDERVFDPALYDRRAVRAEYGFKDADRVILFLGTPRPHKGIFDIADALERLGDDRLVLCIIGTVTDKRTANRFASYKKARISLNPDQPWKRLPELVNLADAVAILQDPSEPISQYQIPAKLTDALAMDVPVLARAVPPLLDLALANAFEVVTDDASLDAALRRVAAAPARGGGKGTRSYFLSELSYEVNAARLDLAYSTARRGQLVEPHLFEQTFRILEELSGVALPRLVAQKPRQELRAPLVKGERPRDLVFLWKQNDSDVYGRRSDMLAKYMLETGRVRRIIHLDRPISVVDLERQAELAAGEAAHQGSLVYVNTVKRILRTADAPDFIRRTFLHRAGPRAARAFGQELRPASAYPDFVREVLAEVGCDEAPMLWVSPVIFEYPEVADAVRPGFVVADLIDDQRTFPGSSEAYTRQIERAYQTILTEADTVFSNCAPVRDAFASLRPDIHVVPNGAEILPDVESWGMPPELRGLPRPIIGYVGNMRDRVDLELIEAVARRYPHGSIALVGSAHGRPEVAEMSARCPNIHLLGVRPYETALRIMRGFDVAMIPHLKSDQSDRMNPLKLYVYFAVGVPVVTTDVANIQDIGPYVSVAASQKEFIAAIDATLAGRGPKVDPATRAAVLNDVSWETRVNQIWRVLEEGTS